ncbi:unnamed protein product, partial [Mesorhabditis spiculigera]
MSSGNLEQLIEKLTAESVVEINWDGFVELSDRLKKAPGVHKDAINFVKKRLNNRDPHIVQNAIELLDFLWKNVSGEFRRELSSKKNISEIQSKATASEHQIARKMREKLREWVNEECKKDPALSLIESLHRELVMLGLDFPGKNDPAENAAEKKLKEALLRSEEERQLREAIQESLKVASSSSTTSVGRSAEKEVFKSREGSVNEKPKKEVKAIYDFPAAEENELSFKAGEVIAVLEDSNPHWWRARLNGKIGLIPAQFVEDFVEKKESVAVHPKAAEVRAKIDESTLLKTIELLQQCDPAGIKPDPEGLQQLEAASNAQAPLINEKLAQIDRLTNMLAKVDMSIRNVLSEYDSAVRNPVVPQPVTGSYSMQMPGHHPVPYVEAALENVTVTNSAYSLHQEWLPPPGRPVAHNSSDINLSLTPHRYESSGL